MYLGDTRSVFGPLDTSYTDDEPDRVELPATTIRGTVTTDNDAARLLTYLLLGGVALWLFARR